MADITELIGGERGGVGVTDVSLLRLQVSFRLVEAPTEADMAAHVSALGQSRPGRQQTPGSLGAPTRSAEEDSFQGTQGQAAYLDRVSAASSLLETEPVNFESVLL